MKHFVRSYFKYPNFVHPNSKVADNPETLIKVKILISCSVFIKRLLDQTWPSVGLEEVLNLSVFNFFLNKVTDGALRIFYGCLLQTVGAI